MSPCLSVIRPFALVAGLAALAGCAGPTAPTARSAARVYAADLTGGAKLCTVPQSVNLTAGQTTEATMAVENDGGWCGILVSQSGPKPFSAGLVTERPQNGRLHVHTVGDQTRVDYIPNPAYGGPDAFAVRLMPGGAVLHVAVTVNYTAPPAPPAPTPAPAPARKPTRQR